MCSWGSTGERVGRGVLRTLHWVLVQSTTLNSESELVSRGTVKAPTLCWRLSPAEVTELTYNGLNKHRRGRAMWLEGTGIASH